jgi:hypothetical protein
LRRQPRKRLRLRHDDSRAKAGEQRRNECASFHFNFSLPAGLKLLRRHACRSFDIWPNMRAYQVHLAEP